MSSEIQMPAPTHVQKASRTRPRQKYSAARAFYLTIFVISVITLLSLLKERRTRHGINDANPALFTRTHRTPRDGFLQRSSGGLVQRDQAVCCISLGILREDIHQAHNVLHSADS